MKISALQLTSIKWPTLVEMRVHQELAQCLVQTSFQSKHALRNSLLMPKIRPLTAVSKFSWCTCRKLKFLSDYHFLIWNFIFHSLFHNTSKLCQGSRLTFQFTSPMASAQVCFTSQTRFFTNQTCFSLS